MYAYPNFWGVIAQLYAYQLLGQAYPDLILRFTNSLGDYEKITSIAWHELTHASQLKCMTKEKGLLWASDYWSANVYQQATNTINNGSPYGAKYDSRWQQIALSEGWANYREWLLAKNKLNGYSTIGYDKYGNAYYFSDYGFPINYGEMFDDLKRVGCSISNIEKSLCTYSITGLRDNLIVLHPSLAIQITNIIKYYE